MEEKNHESIKSKHKKKKKKEKPSLDADSEITRQSDEVGVEEGREEKRHKSKKDKKKKKKASELDEGGGEEEEEDNKEETDSEKLSDKKSKKKKKEKPSLDADSEITRQSDEVGGGVEEGREEKRHKSKKDKKKKKKASELDEGGGEEEEEDNKEETDSEKLSDKKSKKKKKEKPSLDADLEITREFDEVGGGLEEGREEKRHKSKKDKKKKKKASEIDEGGGEEEEEDDKEETDSEKMSDKKSKKKKKKEKPSLDAGSEITRQLDEVGGGVEEGREEKGHKSKKDKKKKKKASELDEGEEEKDDKEENDSEKLSDKKSKKKKKEKKEKKKREKKEDEKDGEFVKKKAKKEKRKREEKEDTTENNEITKKAKKNLKPEDEKKKKEGKRVRFSGKVDVFPVRRRRRSREREIGEQDMVRGKRFTPEEDELVLAAIDEYIKVHQLGEEGRKMIRQSGKHKETKGCWNEIRQCIPYRPKEAIYGRAEILLTRGENRHWTPEDLEALRRYKEKHGTNKWRDFADQYHVNRKAVKDAWRRIRLGETAKNGYWTQQEYQTLFDLVNMDLKIRASQKKETKHGMLRDNISWEAISDKMATRYHPNCCSKWYDQLSSPMVKEGLWLDTDDYRLVEALREADAACLEEVEWDHLLDHRDGETCRRRWEQMIRHIGGHKEKSFIEQIEVLSERYCPEMVEYRERYDASHSSDEDLSE